MAVVDAGAVDAGVVDTRDKPDFPRDPEEEHAAATTARVPVIAFVRNFRRSITRAQGCTTQMRRG